MTTVSPAIVALSALLATAVLTDLRSRRIPNTLVATGLVLALGLHALALAGGRPALAGPNPWSPLTGLAVGALALLPLHLLRACGAGDVKLMAMVGTFVGAPAVLAAALATLLAGGVLSLLFLLGRGVAAQTLANLQLMLLDWRQRAGSGQGLGLPAPRAATAARLPYALAIAAGTAAALLWRGLPA